ncbi:MAG: hypothetical protein ABIJ56_04860 [Pseudomonadota bacterium]
MLLKIILSLVFILALSGCAENRSSFFIQNMVVPSDECTVSSDRESLFSTWGLWDIGVAARWVARPLLLNEMEDSSKLNPMASQTNYIQVDGAWVALLDEEENVLFDEYFVHAPVTVYANGGSTALVFPAVDFDLYDSVSGLWGGTMYSIDQLCSSPIMSKILLRIRVTGVTSGGTDVETPYFLFPVQVCCGCSIYYPPDAMCTEEAKGGDDVPCQPGQDGWTDCRQCVEAIPELCDPFDDDFSNPWH